MRETSLLYTESLQLEKCIWYHKAVPVLYFGKGLIQRVSTVVDGMEPSIDFDIEGAQELCCAFVQRPGLQLRTFKPRFDIP